jgi:hypothetical protein
VANWLLYIFSQCAVLCSAFSEVDLLNVNCLWVESGAASAGEDIVREKEEGRKEEDGMTTYIKRDREKNVFCFHFAR